MKNRNEIDQKYKWDLTKIYPTEESFNGELSETAKLIKEIIGNRAPEDYLLWHVYTGPSLLSDLCEIEKKYDVQTNHEAVIVSPVSGCHNGPWLAGYGLAFLRRDDEPLGDE